MSLIYDKQAMRHKAESICTNALQKAQPMHSLSAIDTACFKFLTALLAVEPTYRHKLPMSPHYQNTAAAPIVNLAQSMLIVSY